MIRTYVRYDLDNRFRYCKVSDRNRSVDTEQGFIDENELSPEVIAEAKRLRGYFPSYVELKE